VLESAVGKLVGSIVSDLDLSSWRLGYEMKHSLCIKWHKCFEKLELQTFLVVPSIVVMLPRLEPEKRLPHSLVARTGA
jgi:hypothetical protein